MVGQCGRFPLVTAVSLVLTALTPCSGESEHRTKAATEKVQDLYCYKCDTIEHWELCQTLKDNSSLIHSKCPSDFKICKVQTITMSASTEDMTYQPKLWLLQRNCTQHCEPVCVTIGERTKLRSCTKCCDTSFCNTGNGAGVTRAESDVRLFALSALLLIFDSRVFARK